MEKQQSLADGKIGVKPDMFFENYIPLTVKPSTSPGLGKSQSIVRGIE